MGWDWMSPNSFMHMSMSGRCQELPSSLVLVEKPSLQRLS